MMTTPWSSPRRMLILLSCLPNPYLIQETLLLVWTGRHSSCTCSSEQRVSWRWCWVSKRCRRWRAAARHAPRPSRWKLARLMMWITTGCPRKWSTSSVIYLSHVGRNQSTMIMKNRN
ncbi:hypothetical protein MSG28_004948 [Choristoneura fumiferana]|uniref:Uncharacterized protein n=1 Tax=Choristoneura fumiferana TaxID=7141 RepID=A0ACC0JPN2_CHOFU|nr:hypothetical protein MSG28_004948 [Choristoneura fumiferana]